MTEPTEPQWDEADVDALIRACADAICYRKEAEAERDFAVTRLNVVEAERDALLERFAGALEESARRFEEHGGTIAAEALAAGLREQARRLREKQ